MDARGSIIDLRSDTVTRPSDAMRRAMAMADVGDDVYGEDPTVNKLQDVVAELLGFQAALYVPSGTMANQIAINILTEPGDDVLVGQGAHNWLYETGGAGALSGVQMTLIGTDGLFDAADVAANVKPDNHHYAPTRLLCIENTQNRSGGRVWPRAMLDAAMAAGRRHGLALHMDGARIWNASVASGESVAALARGFDTVSVCLSKGLGAPVGSLLVGSVERIRRAHRVRKRFGGGMRQAGMLAAGALFALQHNRDRLTEDHDNARLLAIALADSGRFVVDVANVESNIVVADVMAQGPTADEFVLRAKQAGVLLNSLGARRIRLVTHLDVSRAQCEASIQKLVEAAA